MSKIFRGPTNKPFRKARISPTRCLRKSTRYSSVVAVVITAAAAVGNRRGASVIGIWTRDDRARCAPERLRIGIGAFMTANRLHKYVYRAARDTTYYWPTQAVEQKADGLAVNAALM